MPRPDKYQNYAELQACETEGIDYRIELRRGPSGICVMTLHGGEIEAGTSELADAIAASDHSFYSFTGEKGKRNWDLHLASVNFDEPIATALVWCSRAVLTIHGCRGARPVVFLGGLNANLKRSLQQCLNRAGFEVAARDGLQGVSRQNICNQSAGGTGAQLELTGALRRSMFEDLSKPGRLATTATFDRLVAAVREALSSYEEVYRMKH